MDRADIESEKVEPQELSTPEKFGDSPEQPDASADQPSQIDISEEEVAREEIFSPGPHEIEFEPEPEPVSRTEDSRLESAAPVEEGTDDPAPIPVAHATPEALAGPQSPTGAETLSKAIELTTKVIGELRVVLDEMELVLEYLEDAERQQLTDERELKQLHRRLEGFQQSWSRPSRPPPQEPPRREERREPPRDFRREPRRDDRREEHRRDPRRDPRRFERRGERRDFRGEQSRAGNPQPVPGPAGPESTPAPQHPEPTPPAVESSQNPGGE